MNSQGRRDFLSRFSFFDLLGSGVPEETHEGNMHRNPIETTLTALTNGWAGKGAFRISPMGAQLDGISKFISSFGFTKFMVRNIKVCLGD